MKRLAKGVDFFFIERENTSEAMRRTVVNGTGPITKSQTRAQRDGCLADIDTATCYVADDNRASLRRELPGRACCVGLHGDAQSRPRLFRMRSRRHSNVGGVDVSGAFVARSDALRLLLHPRASAAAPQRPE
jgi:hypothetical protein